MAILDSLPELEVTVCVDGKALKEYNDDREEPPDLTSLQAEQAVKTASKYIEAVDDKEFTIKIVLSPAFKMTSGSLGCNDQVDGQTLWQPIFSKADKSHWTRIVDGQTSVTAGRSVVRPVKFGKIITRDDGFSESAIKSDAGHLSNVGLISVQFHRKTAMRKSRNQHNIYNFDTSFTGEVHEKALKGKENSHRTILGKPQTTKAILYDSDYVDGEDHPIAIFKFRYRSNEALKRLHIIERTPEPDEEPAEPPIPATLFNRLSEQERQELEEYLERRSKVNIKRERDDNEGIQAIRKRQKKSAGKVTIDLTDDDDNEEARENSIAID